MASVTDQDVRERLEEVRDLISRYSAAISMLKREEQDLEIAVQVMDGLLKRPAYRAMLPPIEATADTVEPTKPVGIPTVPNMIMEALLVASDNGMYGMEPSHVTAFIRDNYWPSVQSQNVAPTMWRMARDGKLTKNGSVYSLREIGLDFSEADHQIPEGNAQKETAVAPAKELTAEDLM